MSSTCPHNMVHFGPLAAEIGPVVWGTPLNFSRFCILAALLHSILVVGVSQSLRRWTQDWIMLKRYYTLKRYIYSGVIFEALCKVSHLPGWIMTATKVLHVAPDKNFCAFFCWSRTLLRWMWHHWQSLLVCLDESWHCQHHHWHCRATACYQHLGCCRLRFHCVSRLGQKCHLGISSKRYMSIGTAGR